MKNLIAEINSKIKAIINELEQRKEESEDTLNSVKNKIDEKVDEAKSYKVEVDEAKDKIKDLEEDINTLDSDLKDLNERFGNKDLNAIVEAGNREINAKIISKQNAITKYREQIGELTEKARAIKDLLINLKKDKETKENKLSNYTKALDYYTKKLNEVINFADENPDSLEAKAPEVVIKPFTNEPIIDSPVFDEIDKIDESMDSSNAVEEKEPENILEPENISEPEHNAEPETKKIDFQALNNSIDTEYANIFGSSDDIKLDDIKEPVVSDNITAPKNIFDQNDLVEEQTIVDSEPVAVEAAEETPKVEPLIPEEYSHSGLTETDIFGNSYKEPAKTDDSEIVNFFTSLGVDYFSFSVEDQNYLKAKFNADMFRKTIEVLRRNNIDLENVYRAAKIFGDTTPSELEHVISKLLLAGQTTANIGYVLDTLPTINSFDLNEVITSYGPLIKDANITDLIIKAKHLNDMGGNH